MADGEDIQPLVCDNGTGMVKVCIWIHLCVALFVDLIGFGFGENLYAIP